MKIHLLLNHTALIEDDRKPTVTVYSDCIYLRGRDFVRNGWVGIGTYRIEVTA